MPLLGKITRAFGVLQEMTLDEYEKLIKEKNTNLNKAPPAKSAQADPKEFAGMTAYTRKVCTSFGPISCAPV